MQQTSGNITPKYPQSFTGKERDSETGFSYFGTRYYDSDILTGWLSVDPMADKYPGLSPYAYCAWNPVKLVASADYGFAGQLASPRLQDNESTRQLVVRQPLVVLWSCRLLSDSEAFSIPFRLLPLVFRQQNISAASQ